MLTKEDVYAIRHADDICVHLTAKHPKGLVRLIKRKPYYNAKPFETDQEHELHATVAMDNAWKHGPMVESGAVQCFAMAGIYHEQQTHVSSVLKTLRVGDELRFRFYPDAHTTQYGEELGLHGDSLYLDVYRDGKRKACFELETSMCPDNSARMCRGVPGKAGPVYSIA